MRNKYNSLSIYKKTVKIFNLRYFERLSSLLSSTIACISAWAIVKSIELKYEFADLGGEMMFGLEIEAGSLHNRPYTQGRRRIKFARK
jgi:hypothetical protein